MDFGEFEAINDRQLKTYHELVVSFPYSNTGFSRVLPAENTVCFFHGLQSIFAEIGGVPHTMRFDNMSPIVKDILEGTERALTDMFKTFQWHYRFKAEFCNPGKGNEKGSVENKVGYVRRNNFSPIPVIDDLEEFNKKLAIAMREDRNRVHYRKGVLIDELWQDDANSLLTLPHAPLEVVRVKRSVVNKYGEIKVDKHVYRVPNVPPRCQVLIKAYWDRLEILDEYGEKLLYTCSRIYLQDAKSINWAAELEIFMKRPRAVERAVYLRPLPENIKEFFLSTTNLCERRDRIKAMVDVLREYPRVAERAAANIIQCGKTDEASLKDFAAYEAGAIDFEPIPLKEPWTPSDVAQWQPDLSAYDLLRMVGIG